MGFPLWGHDLDRNTTPLEAGLGWVVGWDHPFIGRDALVAQRDGGLPKRLIGFRFDGRTIPREGHAIQCGDATGIVTSGNFSPMLESGIGLGHLSPPPDDSPPPPDGTETLDVEIRGDWHTAQIVDPPFIDR
jgi:aminomethyltransferase